MSRQLSKPETLVTPQFADAGALGRVVRAHRLAAGLRIDDAAALCGVSVTVFSRLENAASAVTTKSLFNVLDGLGLSLLVFRKVEIPQVLATLSQPARK